MKFQIGKHIFSFHHVSYKMQPIDPDCGELYTIEEFAQYCDSGCFTGWDGGGEWSNGKEIFPSNVCGYPDPDVIFPQDAPKGATHVVWYNK